MKLSYKEITDLIPHRPPFLFVDECEILEVGKKGISSRIFKEEEYFFHRSYDIGVLVLDLKCPHYRFLKRYLGPFLNISI